MSCNRINSFGYDFELFSRNEKLVINIVPRICAALSFFASAFIAVSICKTSHKLTSVYHRIVLAMALHAFILSVANIVGSLAVPQEAPGYIGNHGTELSCKIQGFVGEFSMLASFLYYSSLSMYAFVAVRSNFKKEYTKRVEKFTHFVVNALSFSISMTCLLYDMIVPSGPWCWVGINHETKVDCDRKSLLLRLLLVAPHLSAILLATALILLLIFIERRKERKKGQLKGKRLYIENARIQKSWFVMKQSALYLGTVYLSYSFSIVGRLYLFFTGTQISSLAAIGFCFSSIQGFLFMLVYKYLLISKGSTKHKDFKSLKTITSVADLSRINAGTPVKVTQWSMFEGLRSSEVFESFGVYLGPCDDEDDIEQGEEEN